MDTNNGEVLALTIIRLNKECVANIPTPQHKRQHRKMQSSRRLHLLCKTLGEDQYAEQLLDALNTQNDYSCNTTKSFVSKLQEEGLW
jgi:hypothetical protein